MLSIYANSNHPEFGKGTFPIFYIQIFKNYKFKYLKLHNFVLIFFLNFNYKKKKNKKTIKKIFRERKIKNFL